MNFRLRSVLVFFFFSCFSIRAQEALSDIEKYPVFESCAGQSGQALTACFNNTLQSYFFENFKTPEIVSEENYVGTMVSLLEVTAKGEFKVLYTEAAYQELKDEVKRVLESLPEIEPATYNAKPTYVQFQFRVDLPIGSSPLTSAVNTTDETPTTASDVVQDQYKNEYEEIKSFPYQNEEYTSQLNIPLSHQNYALFDPAMNQVGINNHTAQKPFVYAEVNKYYDFEAANQQLLKKKSSWLGRKWWNEHMGIVKGEDYWFTIDPGVDLQVGRGDGVDTYNNTRLVYFQGGLGKKLNFFAAVFESQGRFAGYFNRYAESLRPDGGNPAIIPGRNIAEPFRTDSYDYPVAEGYLSYAPSKHFNVQLGHGKNFIGDGYRSLLLSDNSSPYPYLRLNTTFWKLKYTNTWMSLRDVRSEVTLDGSFRTKYMANHYLSINVTKRLNIGLFEAVMWENDNDRGFDVNYLNPVIFYRAIEFTTGSRGGNAIIGLSGKYKFSDQINAYSQVVIDEFSSGDVFGGDQSWKNKLGFQLGAKYYNAFGVKNLYLQAEYNQVRPYTYSHNSIVLNYGHQNQPMAHLWGANFREGILIARYFNGRWFGSAKLTLGERGFDFNTTEDSFYYGGDIYRDEADRPFDTGIEIGQGNTTSVFIGEFQGGYLINPATNLKVYASLLFRDFTPNVDTATEFASSSTWFNLGIRTDLFNWYFDF